MLLIIEVIWPQKTTKVEKKVYNFENRHNFHSPPKKRLGTRRDEHTKKLESINYAGTLPWKVFIASHGYWKWSDNIWNLKFAVSQWLNSHTFNFLYEIQLYGGNAILEMLYSRLKKIIRDSRVLVDKKESDFVLSWTSV